MKSMKLLTLFVVFSFLIFFACSDDNDSNKTLDVDQTVLTFQPGVETKVFTISTIEEWYITCSGLSLWFGPNIASTDWFDISPVSGTGNAQISITTKDSTHNNSAILQIKYGKKEKTVTLNQN